MRKTARSRRKKYFTVDEANAMLPLLRSVLRDVTEAAQQLRDRHERLSRLRAAEEETPMSITYKEEMDHIEAEFENDRRRMAEYEQELRDLGVELKDYFTGLVDFPHLIDDRQVYLCWQLGEAEVSHWHELDSGFAGRQSIPAQVGSA